MDFPIKFVDGGLNINAIIYVSTAIELIPDTVHIIDSVVDPTLPDPSNLAIGTNIKVGALVAGAGVMNGGTRYEIPPMVDGKLVTTLFKVVKTPGAETKEWRMGIVTVPTLRKTHIYPNGGFFDGTVVDKFEDANELHLIIPEGSSGSVQLRPILDESHIGKLLRITVIRSSLDVTVTGDNTADVTFNRVTRFIGPNMTYYSSYGLPAPGHTSINLASGGDDINSITFRICMTAKEVAVKTTRIFSLVPINVVGRWVSADNGELIRPVQYPQ